MMRAVAVMASLLLALAGCKDRRSSCPPPSRPSTPRDYKAVALKGVPLVQAIYKYKHENGLWPHSLAALVPEYATADQTKGWHYDWHWYGLWRLENSPGSASVRVQYMYWKDHTGWFAYFGGTEHALDVQQPPPATQPIDPGEVTRRAAAQLRRRVDAEPDEMEHLRALAGVYVRAGDFAHARTAVVEFSSRYPKHVWGPWALSYIDAGEGRFEAGEQRLHALVAAAADLASYYALFDYYRAASARQKALSAIRASLALKQLGLIESTRATAVLYDMARFSHDASDYELLLAVADRWERTGDGAGPDGDEYLVLRALAYLRLGRYAEAEAAYQATMARTRRIGLWFENLESIKAAIERRDARFEYNGWFKDLALPQVRTPYQ